MIDTLTKPIATWQPEYETGNLEIDGQHQELFAIVNSLHDAVVTKQEFDKIQVTLNLLANHTIEHFQTEEELMIAGNYPEYDRHKRTHDRLTSKVFTLIQKFHDRDETITTEVTQFLSEWLSHHIKGEDRKMIQFFQNNILPVSPELTLTKIS